MRAKSVQETSKTRAKNFSKHDPKYWESRVFKPTYTHRGETHSVEEYSVKIQHQGRRHTFQTGETSKREAGKKALKIYLDLRANGWNSTLANFKTGGGASAPASDSLTVGHYLALIESHVGLKTRTFHTYANKFRSLVGHLFRLDGVLSPGEDKHDRFKGGAQKWRSAVEAVKLVAITPGLVQEWKAKYIRGAGESPLAIQRRRHSVNSLIRNSRSLFSNRVIETLGTVTLPDPLPFANVRLEKESIARYRSEIDPEQLLIMAKAELGDAVPEFQIVEFKGKPVPQDSDWARGMAVLKAERRREAFKILLLALTVGLRRDEIDKLLWSQVRWNEGVIRIETTRVFSPKADSAGDIPVDEEIIDLLRTWKEESNSDFVIKGNPARPGTSYQHYRAGRHYKELVKWLRHKGVTSKAPIHAMRKEFGSILCSKAGIYVASRLLRHSDIRVTTRHYTDDRDQVTSGLGRFLRG